MECYVNLKEKTDYTIMYYAVDGDGERLSSDGSTAIPKNAVGPYEMVVTAAKDKEGNYIYIILPVNINR